MFAVAGMQSGGLAITGVTNLAFLMDDAMSGLNDVEPGVSTSWLGTSVEGNRRKLPEDNTSDGADSSIDPGSSTQTKVDRDP
jgi:hypothetical protein